MTDKFNVTGAWDKPAGYVGGDKMTGKISGGAVKTVVTQVMAGPIVIPLIDAAGDKSTLTMPAVPMTITTTLPESVTIDTSLPIVDNGPKPLVWTVGTDKLTFSATAPLTP